MCVRKIRGGGQVFRLMYLGEVDQYQQGEDVGMFQLERQLFDVVVCEGGNDITLQWGIVE